MGRQEKKQSLLLNILVLCMTLFCGTYFEYSSCTLTMFLIAWYWRYREQIRWKLSWAMVGIFILVTGYALSPLWAIDRGLAAIGFSKFFPLLLLAVVFQNCSKEVRQQVLWSLPQFGCVVVLVSAGISLVPSQSAFVIVNHRLAGTFQYPNVFGLFLLLGLAVLSGKEHWNLKQWVMAAVLIGGILASGSRTVFLMLGGFCLFALVCRDKVKGWHQLLVMVAFFLLGSLMYVWFTGDLSAVGRYLTTSLNSSTFLGRLLYMKDALPVILRHPLGLGYMGYYFTQGSFQHGVYSVAYVHNDLMQIFLDVGWLPGIAFLVAVGQGLLSPHTGFTQKLIIILILLHSMLDFDLQYLAIFSILLLCLDLESGWECNVRLSKPVQATLCVALLIPAIWLGSSSLLLHLGRADLAAAVFPANTRANIHLLVQAQTAEEMEQLSDRILRTNDSLPLAWSAKAEVAFSRGDVASMIQAKRKVIEGARYVKDEYLDYFQMLLVVEEMFQATGDHTSAAVCRSEMWAIQNKMEQTLAETDPLAWQIADKPDLSLPLEYERYLAED